MHTPMTQEEFEGRMALHAEYLELVNANKVAQQPPEWFKHEDLSNIDTKGHNFDEVNFTHCHLPIMDLCATTFSQGAVYIDHCTVDGIFADHCPEMYLNLIECRVAEAQLYHIGNLNLYISDGRVETLTIRHSALELTANRSHLGRTTLTECEGAGLELSRVTGRLDPLFIKNNAFENIRFHCVERLGFIRMPIWDVNYCGDLLQIGCQQHPIEAWKNFTDDEIDFMDSDALEWWKQYKETVLVVVEANHASMPKLGTQLRCLEEMEQEFKQQATRFSEVKKARQQAKERLNKS